MAQCIAELIWVHVYINAWRPV